MAPPRHLEPAASARSEPPARVEPTSAARARGAREIVVPLELTAEDLERGIVLRLAVRLGEEILDDSRDRRAA
jgi:hypothetical protein